MLAIAVALPAFADGGPSIGWWLAAIGGSLVMTGLWWFDGRQGAATVLGAVAALLTFPVALLLEKADADHAAMYAPVLVLPVAWCALYHRGRAVVLSVVVAGASLMLPILLIGAPGYPPSMWRRALLWIVVVGLIAPASHTIVGSTRRAAARLSASEQRYRSAFTDAPVAIAIIGAVGAERGRIVQANHPLHELLGARPGTLVGRDITDFADPDDIEALTRTPADGDETATRSGDLRLTQASGRQRWVSVSLVLVRDSAEEPARFVCHLVDITLRRESEHALLEALEQQASAAAQVRDMAAARTDMLAAMSHDIRTPLTTMSAYIQLLEVGEGGALTTDQRHMLDVVAQNLRRVNAITDDVLTLGHLEHLSPADVRDPVTIGEVLARVVHAALPSAAARQQKLSLISELDEVRVAGHVGQLDRVLANLLTNAVKFTPDGGKITVRGLQRDEQVVIEVTDTGPGIAADEQDRIFERYYRSEDARSRRTPGTGLGLAIVKEIATLHGGSISVTSTPGAGSTFTLTLPAMSRVA